MTLFIQYNYFDPIIAAIVLFVACSPKSESQLEAIDGEFRVSNDPIKSYSEFYLHSNIYQYDLQNWKVKEDFDDTLFVTKNFFLENSNDLLLFPDTVKIKKSSLYTLNDSLVSVNIDLATYYQRDLDENATSIMTEYLISKISDSYSLKYGKPTSIDGGKSLSEKNLFVNWDFTNYSISLKAIKLNSPLTIFQVSSKDKERYRKYLEKLQEMSFRERFDYNKDSSIENEFEGISNTYPDIYSVSISYKSKYFDPQFSEKSARFFNKFNREDSLSELERIKK